MAQKVIDLSYNLDASTPPFPSNPGVEISVLASIPEGHPPGKPGHLNASVVGTSVHTGTHLDAPFHFTMTAKASIRFPFNSVWGLCCSLTCPIRKPTQKLPLMIWFNTGNQFAEPEG